MGTVFSTTDGDAPVAGRADFRPRPMHPAFDVPDDMDPVTARLTILLRLHKDRVKFRAVDVNTMDAKTKAILLSQLDEVFSGPLVEVTPR